MKKTILALAALALVGCAKEAARTEVVEPAPVATGRVVTITAAIDPVTKTAYDEEGKFAWVAGDKIGVMVFNEETDTQVEFVADADGAITTFTGVVPEGYKIGNYASYPFEDHSSYISNDLVWSKSSSEEYGWRIWGSTAPDQENPLSCTPLLGTLNEDGQSFSFKTATGIVKFTVVNVPMDVTGVGLKVPEGSNVNGWYDVSETGYLSMAHAVEPWTDKWIWSSPTELNSTMEFYFFLPVGKLLAGTTFSLVGTDLSFEFKKDVEVVRNAITKIAPITLEPAPVYTLDDVLGTYDMTVEYGYSFVERAGLLVLEESDDPSKGNIMITKFAGISGKQYGTFDGETHLLTFDCDDIFGDNPYYDNTFVDESGLDTRIFPYLALDFYSDTVIDPQFEVLEPGKIQAVADMCGFRACTEQSWLEDSHNGSWPWTICYTSLIATWHVEEPGSTGEDMGDPVDVDPWTE